MADLKVEKQALLSDANVWHQASGDLDEPAATIQPLTLNGADDVMGLGSRLGIDTTYERARTKMLQLIEQAKIGRASCRERGESAEGARPENKTIADNRKMS